MKENNIFLIFKPYGYVEKMKEDIRRGYKIDRYEAKMSK